MHALPSKLPEVGTSIFAVMTKLANENNAINLAQGFPDFQCPEELKSLVYHYMQKGFNQYAPMPGVPALRQKIAAKIEETYGEHFDLETEITVTAGATQALFSIITAVVHPGDEAIIFEPAYDSYKPAIELCGGKCHSIPLTPGNFSIDWEFFSRLLNKNTRLVIINTPHNPTGRVFGQEDMATLEKLLADTDTLLISDEVYEHIVFDNLKHYSAVQFPGLRNRTFAVSSFGKTYHTTGWKMGYVAASPGLTAELRKVHQFTVFAANTPIQYAYADFLDNKSHYLELNSFYQAKRDCFVNALEGSRFGVINCEGTYFQMLDYSAISDKHDREFTEWLTKEHKIALIPVSPFMSGEYNERFVRVCFAKDEQLLRKAAAVLKAL